MIFIRQVVSRFIAGVLSGEYGLFGRKAYLLETTRHTAYRFALRAGLVIVSGFFKVNDLVDQQSVGPEIIPTLP